MTGQCKFDGNLFCFFLFPPQKKKGNPPTLQHIAKPHKLTRKPKLVKELQFNQHSSRNIKILNYDTRIPN